jgi:16S rRNA (guanine527-N7)-methyltransferase
MEIGSEKWKNIIYDGAKVFDIHLEPEKIKLFAVHAKELLNWNRKINLTAVTDPFEIAVKHCVDSIAPARLIPPKVSVLDIGSGGGFPGIPLKILIPSLSVTLIDASRKKVNFLKHVIRTLKLTDITVCHIRAEEIATEQDKIGKPSDTSNDLNGHCSTRLERDCHKPFDVIISRALSSLNDFIFMALPLIAKDGMIIALRGKVSETELESVRSYISDPSIALAFGMENLFLALAEYKLPFVDAQRSIVTICSNRRHAFPQPNIAPC